MPRPARRARSSTSRARRSSTTPASSSCTTSTTPARSSGCRSATAGTTSICTTRKTGKVKNQITQGEWVVRGVDRVDDAEAADLVPRRRHPPGAGSVLHPLLPRQLRRHRPGRADRGRRHAHGRLLARPPVPHRHLFARRHAAGHRAAPRRGRQAGLRAWSAADWSALLDDRLEAARAVRRQGARRQDRHLRRHLPPDELRPDQEISGDRAHLRRAARLVRAQGVSRRSIAQQALAELGFIVVQIDGMGTSNRSKAFHDVCWKNLGDAGFPDRILWIKAAAAKYPYMDLDRVGIYGSSAGGQNALGGAAVPRRLLQGRPSPTAAATTTAWTRSGGTSSGWAGRSARTTPSSRTSP